MNKPILRYKKTFYKILAIITGAIVGAISGLLLLIHYGGNYGCFSFIDKITGLSGYESCGSFGLYLGLLIGAFCGFNIYKKI